MDPIKNSEIIRFQNNANLKGNVGVGLKTFGLSLAILAGVTLAVALCVFFTISAIATGGAMLFAGVPFVYIFLGGGICWASIHPSVFAIIRTIENEGYFMTREEAANSVSSQKKIEHQAQIKKLIETCDSNFPEFKGFKKTVSNQFKLNSLDRVENERLSAKMKKLQNKGQLYSVSMEGKNTVIYFEKGGVTRKFKPIVKTEVIGNISSMQWF
jgi:hypothetical protein